MFRRIPLLSLALLLSACSPALNWREVRLAGSELKALLPCKPDHGSRRQSLAGRDIEVSMLGCEAGGALYAVSAAPLDDARQALAVQVQWQANLLGNMRAASSTSGAWSLKGADPGLEPIRLTARGLTPDGRPIETQAVWFARGAYLYHAVVYAERIGSEMSEPFFGGIVLP